MFLKDNKVINNKKVNVLYILTKLELGGAQKICLSLIEGLRKKGNFSGLVCGEEGVLAEQVRKIDSVFLLKSFKREVGIKNIINEIRTFFLMIKRIRILKKKYQNLIVHTHSTKAGFLGRWAAFFAGVKRRIHTVHGFGFHEYQNRITWLVIYFMEFFTSFITTHYVCVSYYDLNIGKRLLPRFSKKSSVIRAAVDWDRFYIPASKIKNEFYGAVKVPKFVIGTVSCFKPQKNIFDLLKAFKRLNEKVLKKDIFLQIIGDGILRKDIENWIEKNSLQNKIELLGWQDNVSKFLTKWDLFVLSSLWEGLPCAIVEARLSRLPVVSYNICGISEVIFDGKNGFLVEVGDWEKLSEKMKLILKDGELFKKMCDYPDNLYDFHNKSMVEQHLSLYRKQLF